MHEGNGRQRTFFCLCGPPGSGKDSVRHALLSLAPSRVHFVPRYTDRSLRVGESDHEVRCVSTEEFVAAYRNGHLDAVITTNGQYYAIHEEDLQFALDGPSPWVGFVGSTTGVLLKTRFRHMFPVHLVFLTVSEEELYRRLRSRGYTENEVERRMKESRDPWMGLADIVISNEGISVEETAEEVARTLGIPLGASRLPDVRDVRSELDVTEGFLG